MIDAVMKWTEEREDLRTALEDLISAARGMPVSYDNLCQSTLDHAIERAEIALDRKAQ
jgi:hypothetical protein